MSANPRAVRRKPVDVVPVEFAGPGRHGDFTWMIDRPEWADTIFVFNDNAESFTAAMRNDPQGYTPGAGNAVIRPLRGTRSAGIPTGELASGGYPSLTPPVRALIDAAMGVLVRTIDVMEYRRVVYSARPDGSLGTGIFTVGDDVRTYIVDQLNRMDGPDHGRSI